MNRDRVQHVIESALAEKSQTSVTIENIQLFAESDSGQFALVMYTCPGYPGSQQAICYLHTDQHVSFFETNNALLEKMDAVARRQRLTWPSVPKKAAIAGIVVSLLVVSVVAALSFVHKDVALVASGVVAVGFGYLLGSQEMVVRCWVALRSLFSAKEPTAAKSPNVRTEPPNSPRETGLD